MLTYLSTKYGNPAWPVRCNKRCSQTCTQCSMIKENEDDAARWGVDVITRLQQFGRDSLRQPVPVSWFRKFCRRKTELNCTNTVQLYWAVWSADLGSFAGELNCISVYLKCKYSSALLSCIYSADLRTSAGGGKSRHQCNECWSELNWNCKISTNAVQLYWVVWSTE